MSDIITTEFISAIAGCIYAKINAIFQSLVFIIVICAFILMWLITICLYLTVYVVITPIVLIKYIFKPRT
jgi:hypothetical protein